MKLLITTSTLPVDEADEVPAFVREQAIHLKGMEPDLEIVIHAPHNHYSQTGEASESCAAYRVHRFHYFWPFKLERLAGRGILPALQAHKWLYAQIPFFIVAHCLSLWRLARREEADLIYAHWFTPQAVSAALVSRFLGISFIFTTHASDVAILKRLPGSAKLVRWVCVKASGYTAVSHRTADKLRSFFSEDEWRDQFARKLEILPMGVETALPAVSCAHLSHLRALHAIDHRPILLYLGRLAEKKGVLYLLEAFRQLPTAERRALQLVIAGEGQLRGALQARAESWGLENIRFTGYVHGQDKAGLLAMAEYLCLPSIIDSSGDSEGMPVVLMEGLAAGKIVLASDVSGGETMLEDGKSGFLFQQKAIPSLAKAIRNAASLPPAQRDAMKAEAKGIAQQFDWQTIAKKYSRLIKEAAHAGL